MTDISDLVRRLERLSKKNKDITLGRTIKVAKLKSFETKYGIKLPDEYRKFILAAGEGASGPVYGLIGLDEAIAKRAPTIYELADPFPAPNSAGELLDFAVGGILPIQYGGCSFYCGIVVTGPNRGEIWDYIEERPGWVKRGRGFASWYSSWLAEEEKSLGLGPS